MARATGSEGRAGAAAVGLRAHSGWAALVVLVGPPPSPAVIDRRRIDLTDPDLPGGEQPYHAAEGLELREAATLLARYRQSARRLAGRGLRELQRDLQRRGHRLRGCGLLLSSGRAASNLATTLASHALIHTADGNHFRDALSHACGRLGVPVKGLRERGLVEQAAAVLGLGADEVARHMVELGRPLGPPWTQDQKLAALAAWLVLASAGR